MVIKKFGKDFDSSGGALTLSVDEVRTEKHASGWVITGKIVEDYYEWVNDFVAVHPEHGRISGNFETTVVAENEEAFQHFWDNHQPQAWDYWDI